MDEFREGLGSTIESDEGSIRVKGRAGLAVTFRGRSYDVHSEMMNAPMSIVLYTSTGGLAEADALPDLLQFVRSGLERGGFTVDLI